MRTEWDQYCEDVYRQAVMDGATDRGARMAVEAAQIEAVEIEITADPSKEWTN